jgi:hypothetical protein
MTAANNVYEAKTIKDVLSEFTVAKPISGAAAAGQSAAR